MQLAEHLTHLRADGALLADAAARAGLDARVPSCPDWTIRDLVRHQGDVHRWAAANLRRGKSDRMSAEELDRCLFTWPENGGLLDWFREGHAQLVATIEQAADDAVAFTFLSAPSARAFWARRQAHETAIHRVDAELALGSPTAFDAAFAADGVDEILYGFASRPGNAAADPPRSLGLHATDTDRHWHVRMDADGATVTDDGAADCMVRATASDLYLLLWNRGAVGGLEIDGAAEVLTSWRETYQIRWGGPTKN
jgi:uncharacterized protein (TIGR03083 family)